MEKYPYRVHVSNTEAKVGICGAPLKGITRFQGEMEYQFCGTCIAMRNVTEIEIVAEDD